jgi:ATP-dependent RNA helicase HelY
MAANLVRRHGPDEAHRLLEQSFAQYQTDASVTRLVARRLERRREVREQQHEAECELGDVAEYRRLVEEERSNRRSPAARSAIDDAVSRLQPGDIVPASTAYGRAAVLSNTRRHGEARVRLVNPHAKVLTRHARDFEAAPDPIGRIALPEPYRPDDPAFQHEVADLLRRARGGKPRRRSGARGAGTDGAHDDHADAVPASEQHPVAACPDARRHLRASAQVERIEVELADLDRRIEGRADSLAHRFDQILQLLEAWSYLDGWALTRRGRQLAGTYHECDLLVVEVLASGLCDDLAPAELAGLISGLTYEHRSRVPAPPPWFPSTDLRQRFEQMEALAEALNDDEAALGLPLTRRPDPTFVPLAHAWALGQQLDDVLADEDLTGGDFVRNVRLLIDLLRQVANHADRSDTRRTAGAAAEGLFHGVIAASSAVGGAPDQGSAAAPPVVAEPARPVGPAEPAGPDPV